MPPFPAGYGPSGDRAHGWAPGALHRPNSRWGEGRAAADPPGGCEGAHGGPRSSAAVACSGFTRSGRAESPVGTTAGRAGRFGREPAVKHPGTARMGGRRVGAAGKTGLAGSRDRDGVRRQTRQGTSQRSDHAGAASLARKALVLQPFQMPSHGRRMGVTVRGVAHGVNGTNDNSSKNGSRNGLRNKGGAAGEEGRKNVGKAGAGSGPGPGERRTGGVDGVTGRTGKASKHSEFLIQSSIPTARILREHSHPTPSPHPIEQRKHGH